MIFNILSDLNAQPFPVELFENTYTVSSLASNVISVSLIAVLCGLFYHIFAKGHFWIGKVFSILGFLFFVFALVVNMNASSKVESLIADLNTTYSTNGGEEDWGLLAVEKTGKIVNETGDCYVEFEVDDEDYLIVSKDC